MYDNHKQEDIDNRVLEIYNQLKESNHLENITIQNITYYNDLTLVQPKNDITGMAEQGVYTVKSIDENARVLYNIYNENMQIATVDENGKIQFSEEYMQFLQEIDPRFFETTKKANGKEQLVLPDEISNEDKIYSTQDIKEIEERKNKKTLEQQNNSEDIKQQDSEEKDIEKMAQVSGMKKEDISSYSTIKPTEKLTDKETFEDIANVSGKYSKIYVISANGATNKNRRFAFMGITKDGNAEYIDGLETRGTTTTDREIYSINRDGSTVKEKQTTEMFKTKNEDKMFSVTIGQYGILEVDYLRKSPTENKFIGSSVETQAQRPTTRQVKEFMNTARTTKYEMKEAIQNTREQIKENESETTQLNNIDDNPYNDKSLDIDEIITLHDGTKTTIRKQAEEHGKAPEEYARMMESTTGDCSAEKIEKINMEIEKREEIQHEEEHLREERTTPEEAALKNMYND